MFRSSKHKIETLEVNKIALNKEDDKRIMIDGVRSFARGHHKLNNAIKNGTSVDKVEKIKSEMLSLFKRKNQQYGNAFAKYGTVGVMIRMGEKINRFLSVSRLKIELKDEEMLRDTLLDLLNYSSMAISARSKFWGVVRVGGQAWG